MVFVVSGEALRIKSFAKSTIKKIIETKDVLYLFRFRVCQTIIEFCGISVDVFLFFSRTFKVFLIAHEGTRISFTEKLGPK